MSKHRKPSSASTRRAAGRRGHQAPPLEPGKVTRTSAFLLRSYEVGALPLIDHILDRMRLEELLQQYRKRPAECGGDSGAEGPVNVPMGCRGTSSWHVVQGRQRNNGGVIECAAGHSPA
jgi:hypothetical protein